MFSTPLELTKATPLELTKATPLELTRATPLELTKATPLELTKATPLELTKATPLELTPQLPGMTIVAPLGIPKGPECESSQNTVGHFIRVLTDFVLMHVLSDRAEPRDDKGAECEHTKAE